MHRTPLLTDDFKEFLRLFNAHRVEYLVVGGYMTVALRNGPRHDDFAPPVEWFVEPAGPTHAAQRLALFR